MGMEKMGIVEADEKAREKYPDAVFYLAMIGRL